MATCTSCGSSLTDADQFCGVCGTPASPQVETATTVTVDVPEWLSADWGPAAKWAGTAALTALVGHFAVLLVLYLGLNVLTGFDLTYVDWGEFLTIPVQMMLGMHGAVEGSGTWITAIVWIIGSLFLTYRVVAGSTFSDFSQGNRWAIASLRAVKVALVYGTVILVGMIVFDPQPVGYQLFYDQNFSQNWNAAAGFFMTVLIVTLGAAYIMSAKAGGMSKTARQHNVWTAGLSGTWRILAVAVGGVFAFFLIAGVLELISNADDFFAQVVGSLLLLLVAALAWAGVDIGLFFMVEAMRFFSSDDTIQGSRDVFGTGASESWFLVASLIVAAAFAIGGYHAARLTKSRDLSKMLQAAGIAGGGVAMTYLVAAAVVGDDLDAFSAGIGLSILWSIVAVAGALIYAQSLGVLQKINVNVQRSPSSSPAPGTSCPTCGTARSTDHMFCANCGHAF